MGSIADICRDGKIFEIQTHSLYRLKTKLEKFLPYYKVCVVFPVVAQKTVYKLNPDSLEVSGKRKSPKKGSVYDFLPEVYGLRQLIDNENLSFCIMVINASEYRVPSAKGAGHRGVKFDMVPDELICEISLNSAKDFVKLLPLDLPEKFGSLEYAKSTHIHRSDAAISLNILAKCGIIEKIDKKGNAFVYRIIE
ncbi:MAG: hypothetical protein E7588_00070 [Ruminococcaceae bacterium]|nr:hypothetical protein [Oscillospiraceae bacterium]